MRIILFFRFLNIWPLLSPLNSRTSIGFCKFFLSIKEHCNFKQINCSLLHSQSTMERVRYFWFMGFTQNREELERQKYIKTREMLEKKNAEEVGDL